MFGVKEGKILIVEDDSGLSNLEQRYLERAGYNVLTAGTSEEALEVLRQQAIVLILLDYRLPGNVDGLEWYGQMRAAGYDLPVILVTAYSNEAIVIKALRSGVRDFITKSAEFLDYLPEAVSRVLHQVRTEKLLAESEARLAGIVNSAMDGIVILSADRRVVLFNPAAERIFGHNAAMVVGQNFDMLIPERHRGHFVQRIGQTTQHGGQSPQAGSLGAFAGLHSTGREFPIEVTISRMEVHGNPMLTAVIRDVTERFEAEQALLASEERFRLLVEGVKDYAIFLLDPEGLIVTWNLGAERITGYRTNEVIGKHISIFHTADGQRTGQAEQEIALANQEGKHESEGWRVRKDGSRFWASVLTTALYDESGRMRGYATILSDLTERRRSEVLLRSVMDHASDGILCIDEEGFIDLYNRGAARIFGYEAEEVVGSNIERLIPLAEDADASIYRTNRVGGAWAGMIGTAREVIGCHKNGKRFPLELGVTEFQFDVDGRRHFIGIARNLSERKELESQLRQAQKMEAIGQLAGGVAHDFNNLLTVIAGYTDLLLAALAPHDPQRQYVQQIHHAGDRAAGLTRQLLAFSRQQVLDPRVLDLNSAVSETLKLIRRLIGEDVQLVTSLDGSLLRVKVDPGQLDQVLMNIAVNARDAMPKGGRFTIATRNIELDDAYLKTHPRAKPGKYVMLSLSDTGGGMSEATAARIFEPFFTTKGPGKGTGLGLAVVHGIVQQSGGFIDVVSGVGAGATFSIYLPAVADLPQESLQAPHIKSPAGHEVVLLVEDEDSVREVIAIVLQTRGYTVLKAAGGKQALEKAEQHAGRIDLLITDVVMPEMSGPQVAEALCSRRPGVKVLLLSGYTDDAILRHGIQRADVSFLQKPFSLIALEKKVREVLDGAAHLAAMQRTLEVED